MAHPYTLDKLTYDFARDMTPIARVTDTVLCLNVPAASANKTLNEFVAEARARPGKLNVTGAPGVPDFTLDYFLKTQGIKAQKISFKNIVEAATALAGNQIDFLLTSVAIVQPLASAGKSVSSPSPAESALRSRPISRPCTNWASAGSGRNHRRSLWAEGHAARAARENRARRDRSRLRSHHHRTIACDRSGGAPRRPCGTCGNHPRAVGVDVSDCHDARAETEKLDARKLDATPPRMGPLARRQALEASPQGFEAVGRGHLAQSCLQDLYEELNSATCASARMSGCRTNGSAPIPRPASRSHSISRILG